MVHTKPVVIGIGGFSSNVGKTTLMCDLLRGLDGFEAIKTTRGHYRSCGKNPQTCCVSHLMSDEPKVLSGWQETYEAGKDTARYWDAGAANVHWVIATEETVGKGTQVALDRVRSQGVLIEGNSFSEEVRVDLMIMVTVNLNQKIKRSARQALTRCSMLFVTEMAADSDRLYYSDTKSLNLPQLNALESYGKNDLPRIIAQVRDLTTAVATSSAVPFSWEI